ncbi:MAG TPA: fibronectin type III domain-containing protein [Mycobacteriales bacterium]|nr:fibronectin type III domain-containing protein [Mycobacteriales bacterium]
MTGLTPATTYTYRVVARNSSGETASDWVTFHTPS